MSDIVERLTANLDKYPGFQNLNTEAAAEITRLRARVTSLSDAARLFADVMKCRDDGPWRDVAAFRERWAIPVDQTVEAFCKQFIASAIRHAEARA